jgi:phage baseplate assembly protein W
MQQNQKRYFLGFSTIGVEQAGSTALADVALIRRDLLNHFFTRVGERVMRPEWGCRIWEMLMEPATDMQFAAIREEAIRVCESDPRVGVTNIRVAQLGDGIRVELDLIYKPDQVMDTLAVDFEKNEALALGYER